MTPVTADDPEDELFVIFPRRWKRERMRCRRHLPNRLQHAIVRDEVEIIMSGSGEGAQGSSSAKRFLRKPTWN